MKKKIFIEEKNLKFKKNFYYIGKLLAIYLFFISISTLIFIALFWLKFFDFLDILFFKSFILLLITIFIVFFLLLFLKKKIRVIATKDILIICIFSFTFNNFIYGLIPFNASRSV